MSLFLCHREAKTQIERLIRLLATCAVAALNIADHHDGVHAELDILFRLIQLHEDVDCRLVLLERCSEDIPDNSLLSWLQLCINQLFDRLIFFILDEWLEWPCHFRFILDGEFQNDLTAFHRIDLHEVL